MWKSLLRDRKLWILLFLSLLIRIISLNAGWVERYYTYGFYPEFSTVLRTLLGWIPFSVGDLVYVAAFIFLVLKVYKLIRLLARRQVKEYLSWILFRRYLRLVLWVYVVFNLFWGLNYNRRGIADQLRLTVQKYSVTDLVQVTKLLQQRVNFYAERVDTTERLLFEKNRVLFDMGIRDYDRVKKDFPFLEYRRPSIKSSIFSPIGHWFGFSGYFNPFSGEAQLNTAEPSFLLPFVVNHEIAHQLGYGKENEASFVSYLACRQSESTGFRYSVYYELFFNALLECRLNVRDTALVRGLRRGLVPLVMRDKRDELAYRLRKKNMLQPYVSDFYDNYLKLNNQPKGLATYNQVIAWLIAYMKKNGAEAI